MPGRPVTATALPSPLRMPVASKRYTAVAVCGPARSAMLTGRRPDSTHAWSLSGKEGYWRKYLPNALSLPEHLKRSGWITIGLAKLYHPGAISGSDDECCSWSPEGLPYWHSPDHSSPPATARGWWAADPADAGWGDQDGVTARKAAAVLGELKANRTAGDRRPFFLGVGFHKPHMPEFCPREYYARYPADADIPLARNPDPPTGAPPIAVQLSVAFRKWLKLGEGPGGVCGSSWSAWSTDPACRVNASDARAIRKAYWACISYTDAMLGQVLTALRGNGFWDSTVITLVGDHGWHLGELNQWAKYTVYEQGVRVPFMLHLAGQTQPQRTPALVEAEDIFPTVVEAAGLPPPPRCQNSTDQTPLCVEGTSMAPLAVAPARPWKRYAFSQYPRDDRGLRALPGFPPLQGTEAAMGYSVRSDQWRYTEWVAFNNTLALPDWTALYGVELYSHQASPVPDATFDYDNVNVAADPAHAALVANLSIALRAGWRAAVPDVDAR